MNEFATCAAAQLEQPGGTIHQAEWEERRTKLGEILVGIARHADVQMMSRCPYKNRLGQCTSALGCQNKRRPPSPDELPRCVGDDKIDYRSAWEAEPDAYELMKRGISASTRENLEVPERLRGQL